MKTGEGKTLVSTLPAYLNALEGKGVHIVTVNDYLANRDAEWMGKVHEFLGLTVGVVLNSMKNDERRAQYACDITYVTNNELGFDYLRDNMVIYKEQLVQRDLNYAIIDEVDSVLIDEARTPLIISGQSGKSTKLYEVCDILARQLERGEASGEVTKMTAIMGEEITETGDFIVNEKDKIVNLTEQGVHKVENFFHIENLADPENLEIQHNIILALRAHNLMFRDQDYVVKDDEVLIVDEFTGRIMPGRRYSDGLHQAIEAKEHVKAQADCQAWAQALRAAGCGSQLIQQLLCCGFCICFCIRILFCIIFYIFCSFFICFRSLCCLLCLRISCIINGFKGLALFQSSDKLLRILRCKRLHL